MDFSRLDRNRTLLGGTAAILFLVSIFLLPWFSIHVTPQQTRQDAWICGTGDSSCTGFDTFSKLTYDQALKIARASDTAIYPVSILEFVTVRRGDTIDTLQARNALNTIAKYSGGQAYFPRFEGEIPSIYQQVAGQLRTQYSLGFIPTNPSKDGRFHKLKIDLVDEQGNALRITDQKGKQVKYRVVSRDGYYAPKS